MTEISIEEFLRTNEDEILCSSSAPRSLNLVTKKGRIIWINLSMSLWGIYDLKYSKD